MESESDYILSKVRGFCAFQERCITDVADKLREWKVGRKRADKIIEQLIREDYLNEERFARSYASGKFRINHWGKTKIIYELEKRQVPDLIIQIGLEEIDDEEYAETLKELLQRKNRELRETDPFKRKQKLIAYGIQKGYHYGLVKQVIGKLKFEN
ncbi:MAG: RecX family transcriptional regulator [Bacteroidales bacterium]|nr:RecX family transcriptional regulator [Bacteroidales bacterium]